MKRKDIERIVYSVLQDKRIPKSMFPLFRAVGERVARQVERERMDRIEQFRCWQCGAGVAADEDGCCANCGVDCEVIPEAGSQP